MQIKLHANARTTPAIRRELQLSDRPAKELAEKFGISVDTVYKWRKRNHTHDLSHARHNTLSSINQTEEEVIKALRIDLDLSLDDIVEVMKRCVNPELTRSSIHRCLERNNISARPKAERPAYEKFDVETLPGYIHIDVKHLTKLDGQRSYVYVAIDRATRYVYTEVLYDLKTQTAADFLERFCQHFPFKVRIILTDNGTEFTDRCLGKVKQEATGKHKVDKLCHKLDIEHRLTKIRKPQTNGMVERFNRRINEAIASKEKICNNRGKNSFENHAQRNEFISNIVYSYNHTRLKCLDYQAPVQALCNHPELYNAFFTCHHQGGIMNS